MSKEKTILISKGRYNDYYNDEKIREAIEEALQKNDYVLVTVKPVDDVIYGDR